MEKISKFLIPISVVIGVIIIAGAFIYINKDGFASKGLLSGQEAAEKAVNYINKNKDTVSGGNAASLISVAEEGTVYKIHIKIGEGEYDSYVTKDGRFLFPGVYDMGEETENSASNEANLSAQDLEALAKCLTEKGAKFYGAYWCSWCAQQKEMFGNAAQYLPYVECSEENSQEMTPECKAIGITSYPTWEFNGEKNPGLKSLDDLVSLSGCAI